MSLSATDLEDLTVARCGIEGLAITYAVNRKDIAWESEVLAAHHRLASCEYDESSDEWANVHREFHETLLRGCGSDRLSAVAAQLRDSAEVYRRWSLAFADRQARDISGEHRAIVEAILARDAALAASLLADHVGKTTEVLLNSPDIDWSVEH
nr:FCD domain-containing protein [Microbacterium pseudoresistens]